MGEGVPSAGSSYAPYVPRLLLRDDAPTTPTWWETDGTLVFADVSGFTKLAERLTRAGGKAGSEQLVTTISEVFTSLLSATDDGGDVLKFGGDALLLAFTGPDHALRAGHAALGMQRAIRQVGRIVTPGGVVRLRMSVGAHSGRLPFFLVGRDHLELVVAGQEATCTVDMESAAQAGEVLVSPATARLLDADGVKLDASRSGASLLTRVPTLAAVDSPRFPPPVPDARTSRYIPILLRGRLGHGSEHEHRPATVAFLHFAGVDALLTRRGPEEVFARLQHLATVVEEVTTELGVCIITTDIGGDGGKYYLAAGTPEAGEDDEGRMLRACRRILDADVGMPLRIGVNRGHVFGGDVGAPFRRTYSVMGDTVNLAARIMGKAPFGAVLAHRNVIERSSSRFHTEPVEPFHVKGKTAAVDAALVGPLATAGSVAASDDVPLIGRGSELAEILGALDAVRVGDGAVIEILGRAGIGKSRLAREALRAASHLRRISIACEAYDAASPYFGARLLFRRALGIRMRATDAQAGRELSEIVREQVPGLLPWLPLLALTVGGTAESTPEVEDLDPRFRRAKLHDVAAELLAAVLGPAAILIEDAFWMDEASSDLLAHVLRSIDGHPWLVLITRRGDRQGLRAQLGFAARRIELEPLDRPDAADLLATATASAPPPPSRTEAILDRANGNPLFLLELASAPDLGDDDLPVSIESMLAARVDALSSEDRRTLRYVSVLGTRFSARILDRTLRSEGITSTDDRWDRLGHLLDHDGAGNFRFRSELIQRTAYEGLSYQRRRELHARAATVYERVAAEDASDHSALLSLHVHEAGDFEGSWRYSVIAGDRAKDTYANVDAARFYRRALAAGRRVDRLDPCEWGRIAVRLGDVCELAGLYDDASEAYRLAKRSFGGSPDDLLDVHVRLGILNERMGRYANALRWYGRGIRLAGELTASQPGRLLARLRTGYAATRYRQGSLRECTRWAQQAVVDAALAGDRETLAHAYYLLDSAYTDLGHTEGGTYQGLAEEHALPIYEELGDLIGQADVLNNLGINAYYAGDWDRALTLYSRSREARLRAGDLVGAATIANNIAEVMSDQGRLEEATELFREALHVWRGAMYPVGVALATSNLARVAYRGGDLDEAEDLLREALEGFEAIGARGFVLETQARRAEVCLARGDVLAATGWIDALLPRAAGLDGGPVLQAFLYRLRGQVAVAAADPAAAEASFEESLRRARAGGAGYEEALTLAALADLRGDPQLRAEVDARLARLGVRRAVETTFAVAGS